MWTAKWDYRGTAMGLPWDCHGTAMGLARDRRGGTCSAMAKLLWQLNITLQTFMKAHERR